MKRIPKICLALFLALSSFPIVAYAIPQTSVEKNSYEYNSYEESNEAPIGYVAKHVITGIDMGSTALSEPQDIFITENGEIYILDSGNGRILVLNENMRLIREINQFSYDGQRISFVGATGLYLYRDGTLYLADKLNERVLKVNTKGKVQSIIKKPESDLLSKESVFSAQKVMHDENGITYVLVDGITDGALSFDSDNSFIGFYGSNRIKLTPDVLTDYLWSKFMTQTQISKSQGRIPAQFSNFDIDSDQFIYTVTSTNDTTGNYRKLNFKGNDLLTTEFLGDFDLNSGKADDKATSFVDVNVDGQKFVNLLDQTMGRIFQYSNSGDLVTIFGGIGSQTGNFQNPVAVDSYNGKIYVLDSVQNAVTVFEPTEYTIAKRKAIKLYEEGKYEKSVEYWKTVLTMNSNSEIAYGGIAKAYEEAGEYQKAMKYFELANQNVGYSSSFREVRKGILKENFLIIFLFVIAATVGIFELVKIKKRKKSAEQVIGKLPEISKNTAPLFMLFHPIDCSDEFLKRRKKGSYSVAFLILLIFFIGLSASWFFTGFLFNEKQPENYKVYIVAIQAFGAFLLWCITNWAVCTLIEGKGTFKEILCVTAYGMIPAICAIYIKLGMSNVLILSESSFMTLIMVVGLMWSGGLIFTGLSTVHQFSFKKTISSVILTLIFIAIVLFIITLFYGLIKQVVSFVELVYSEIQMMQ